jgi:hypothetical protein
MSGFVLGIVSSLVATALTVFFGWIGVRQAQRWPVAVLARVSGVGIVRKYASQRSAGSDLAADLAEASDVSIMTGRGNELSRETFQELWQRSNTQVRRIRVLLPDPEGGPDSWLARRETELVGFDPGFTPGLLPEQIRATISYISALADKDPKRIELRVVDLPHASRVIITERLAYVTTVMETRHGHDSPCLVFRKPGPLYDFALRLFESAWEGASPSQTPTSQTGLRTGP